MRLKLLPLCRLLLAAVSTAALPASSAAANLLRNGSFESPVLPPRSLGETNHWPGIAWAMNGGGGRLFGDIWPARGVTGLQYGDFGNSFSFLVKQDFAVPSGTRLERVTWFDSSSAVFLGGSYTVTLTRLDDDSVVATTVIALPAASGLQPLPWVARSLPLPDPLPAAGSYRLSFAGTGMTGLDYLVDDIVAEAFPAASTIDATASSAYSADAGWINFRPTANDGLRIAATYLSGRAYAANFGWIDFGRSAPVNGSSFSQSATDYGVNLSSDGTLSGYAYSANVGWINFGRPDATHAERPHLDRASGAFTGYAFSANLGWINLGSGYLRHDAVQFPDTDYDGLPDSWELAHFGGIATADRDSDTDGDGVSDASEYAAGTDPQNIDSPSAPVGSTLSTDSHFLYAANAGWIDARPSHRHGLRIGEYFLSGWMSSPNLGWISVGDGTPTNGHAYANSDGDAADYGLNLAADGALSGYAYAPNFGWVSASWAGPNDPNRPRLNLATGVFSGHLYAANVGWISFGGDQVATLVIDRPDTDADGMADAWEMENFGNLTTAGVGSDADADGQSDAAEYLAGTDPRDAADWFRITSLQLSSDLTQVTIEFTSDVSRRYRVQHTTDLMNGPWLESPLGEFAPDAGVRTTRTFTVSGAATARFFRLAATLPLSTSAAR